MQNYKKNYRKALRDLFVALNQRSPTCWKTYWSTFHLFYISKITKNEYNKLILDLIGEENIQKHNAVLFSLLNLSSSKMISNSANSTSPIELTESNTKQRNTHKMKKRVSSKDVLTYTDRLIKEDVPLLLQYWTSAAQNTPLLKNIKSTYQKYEASLSQKRPKSTFISLSSPYENIDYSLLYTSSEINSLLRNNIEAIHTLIQNTLSILQLSLSPGEIKNIIPILRIAMNIYICRICYIIKIYCEPGLVMMRTHIKGFPSQYSNYIPMSDRECLYVTLPLFRQIMADYSYLLGPLVSYHLAVLNTMPMKPIQFKVKDQLGVLDRNLSSMEEQKGDENDSENQNIENL